MDGFDQSVGLLDALGEVSLVLPASSLWFELLFRSCCSGHARGWAVLATLGGDRSAGVGGALRWLLVVWSRQNALPGLVDGDDNCC